MADHAELIANFVAVSGATPEQAQFYLEANNWDINVTGHEQPLRGTTGRQEQLQEDYVDEDDDEDLNDVLAQPAPKSASKK
ncbi:hypothetical protein BGZ52_003943 [Haplosporangium bisporale]|uniref:Uncharacterized protein n=1 Tax=Podila verticillata NRRL 6337 TaxID=1069443 RepID=A0A086TIT7_9FUNG|nr:hypothetical protein BGZ52_003943 [Haplosporangium bisporale]KAF9203321.1 hypothetical protein BGZ59_001694 [Podila verticillata]KFH61864.1 hypothetical protein MVEG_12293 [Podila verticillata NRRL 6337]